MRSCAALAVLAGLCGAPAAASDLPAPDLPTKKPAPELVAPALPSSWRFEITGYGWGTDLSGEAGVGPFPSSPFFINFLKLLEHFQGGLMTAFVARNDTFIAGLDVLLSRIGGGTNFRDPTSALFGDHATLTLTQGIVTAFGGVRIPVGPPNLQLYGTIGARWFYMRTALDLSFPVTGFSAPFRADQELGGSGRRPRRPLRDQRQMVRQLPGGHGRARQQRDRPGSGLGRLQLDVFDLDHARLSRALYLRAPDQRTSTRLPLSGVDVRTVRRVQIQLLASTCL